MLRIRKKRAEKKSSNHSNEDLKMQWKLSHGDIIEGLMTSV